MITATESFVVKEGSAVVLFRYEEHAGMVGETVESYTADLLEHDGNGRFTVTNQGMNHLQLAWVYKYLQGKKERMSFWGWMREFSDERVEQRRADQRAEAVSRVI